MESEFTGFLLLVSQGIEITGIVIITIGGIFGLVGYLNKVIKNGGWLTYIDNFKTGFAKSILLGLEFLVAADIVGTITVQPKVENLYSLGLIILIRTFLSFSLSIEISGSLPWRRGSST